MSKSCVLDLKLHTKKSVPKGDTIIRVSPEIYQILKDFSHEADMSIKDLSEILIKFALEHVKVSYAEG